MAVCDLNSGHDQLVKALVVLKERWMETRSHWNDEKSRDLESTELREMAVRTQQLLTAAHRLAELLARAERECGDHEEIV